MKPLFNKVTGLACFSEEYHLDFKGPNCNLKLSVKNLRATHFAEKNYLWAEIPSNVPEVLRKLKIWSTICGRSLNEKFMTSSHTAKVM